MDFQILSEISNIEIVARGRGIRNLPRLCRAYGKADWRKLKGIARVRLATGHVRLVELHWYEAHGKGRKEMKRKRFLD